MHTVEAFERFRKALSVKERAFGKDHPSTARTYNNIGAMQVRLADYAGAVESHSERWPFVSERTVGTTP